MFIEDTIAAISTPRGKGALAVIRLSGSESIKIACEVFKLRASALAEAPSRYASFGHFYSDGKIIDDGIAVVYRAPNSFTGQNMVELSCHGGMLVTQCILEELFSHGARAAEAGEFTRRAYCNGKLDLTQAEAVALTLEAKNHSALILGASQRSGVLSEKINSIFEKLASLIAAVYVFIDFPDELLSDVPPSELRVQIEDIQRELISLRASYRTGKALSDGISTVIFGKPNSGKSSLLNRLLGEERAIVTELAGTTRDTIEEIAVIGGMTLRLCDTAGIRDATDKVENLGISRAVAAAEAAELVIAMFDGASELDADDEKVIGLLCRFHDAGKIIVVLINKSDLPQRLTADHLAPRINADAIISVSAATGEGIDFLSDKLRAMFIDETLDFGSSAIITSSRQYAAILAAENRLENAIISLDSGMTADIVGFDLEEALGKLGELDGRRVSEEVVDNIFHNFCVGK